MSEHTLGLVFRVLLCDLVEALAFLSLDGQDYLQWDQRGLETDLDLLKSLHRSRVLLAQDVTNVHGRCWLQGAAFALWVMCIESE